MPIKDLMTPGIGFHPGSVKFTITRGLGKSRAPVGPEIDDCLDFKTIEDDLNFSGVIEDDLQFVEGGGGCPPAVALAVWSGQL
jgi:hypothetical protein